MISWNDRVTCETARRHYYDCLEDREKVDVPQGIRDHVKECTHCRKEIERLDRILNSDHPLEAREKCHAEMINSLLNLHFRYAESVVTCSSAKLFFASLADPKIELRVPTPITTHIDHCPQCADDLRTLKGLDLSNEQLRHLNQFYADLLTKEADGRHADDTIVQAVATVRFSDIDTETLKHLCVCTHCRDRVTMARRVRCRSLGHNGGETLCNTVNKCDLFDYVLPYGMNPLSDPYCKFREALVDHFRECPICLNRMLEMSQCIYAVGDRPDSGVATCFHIGPNTVEKAHSPMLYEGYPICVDVRHSSGTAESTGEFADRQETRSTTSFRYSIRRLRWPRIAAMLVLVLGLSVFSWLPKAGADYWDKIYQATLDVPVLHIEMTQPETGIMLREFWVFPKANYVIMDEKDATTALDLNGNTLTTLDHQSGQLDKILLKADMRRHMEQNIRTLFNLMPFGFQPQLVKVPNENLDGIAPDEASIVYEAEWTDTDGAVTTSRRWRAYVDPSSNHLLQVHWYETDPFTGSFSESRCDYIDYPTPDQVEYLLEKVKLSPVTP